MVPKLFYNNENEVLVAFLAKIVADLLVTGFVNAVSEATARLNDPFKLSNVSHSPGALRLYGLNVVQNADYSITIVS